LAILASNHPLVFLPAWTPPLLTKQVVVKARDLNGFSKPFVKMKSFPKLTVLRLGKIANAPGKNRLELVVN